MPSYQLDITVQGHDRASGVFKPLEGSLRRILEVAGGILASRVILGIADHVGRLLTSSVNATAQLQLMQVSLESLAGRELVRASEGMKTLADVEFEAGEMAREMIDKISRISILSPYTVEAVQNTFRLNTAFGYTFKEAERMTEGLLKMAAGVGADNEQLNRMAYNLAQVRLQGKVTALDIRQLALAGIDLRDVLKNVSSQLGFNIEDHLEFNELIASGQITWEQFSVEFAEYADKYFGKSSEKMARTLLGLKSTFHDVFILTMPKVIGPSVEKVTAILGKLLDMFIKVRDTDILEKMGLSWSRSVDRVLNPISTLIDGINDYIDVWLIAKGYVEDGMGVRAAAQDLQAMQTPLEMIKETINDMFGPQIGAFVSRGVDKILSAIDKIKTAFKSLTEGDIEQAFRDLGVPQGLIDFVNDVMRAVGNLQDFWEQNGDDVGRILKELALGLLDFGGDQINTGMEEAGGFFETLTQRIVDNGPRIIEKLETIKDSILNDVLPAVDRFIDKVVNEWIPAAVEFGTYLQENWQPILEKVLTVIITLIAVSAGFKIFMSVVGFVMALVSAFGSLGTALVGFATLTTAAGGIAAAFTAALPVLIVIVGAIATVFVTVIGAITGFIVVSALVIKHWNTIKEVLTTVWGVISSALKPAFDALLEALTPLQEAGKELGSAFMPVVNLLGAILMPVLKVLATIIGAVLISAIANLVGFLTGVLNLITGLIKTFTAVVQSIATIVTGIVNVVAGIFQTIVGLVTGDSQKMADGVQRIWMGLKQVVGGIFGAILSTITGILGSILSFALGWTAGFASVWRGVWNTIASKTTGTMNSIATTIRNGWDKILALANNLGDKFRSVGPAIIAGIKEGIQKGWGALVSWFRDKINSLINGAMSAAGIHSPSEPMIYMGKMMTKGLRIGLEDFGAVLRQGIVAPVAALPNKGPSNSYDSHNTAYYAPVYQIVQQAPDRFSTQGVG